MGSWAKPLIGKLQLKKKGTTPATQLDGLIGISGYLEEGTQNENLFISFSSKDFSWVAENLIPSLDKHAFPYSIHRREFEPGRSIAQNMADSVYNSREVLIVLSNNYLASNFCREELHMALQPEEGRHGRFVTDSYDHRQVEEKVVAMCADKKEFAGF